MATNVSTFFVSAILWFYCCHCIQAVPTGFVDELVTITKTGFTTTGGFAKSMQGDNLLFLGSKRGKIFVMINPDTKDTDRQVLLMKLPVCDNGERGVQTIVAHPDFETNGYLYIYRTEYKEGCYLDSTTGPQNRLSRFTVSTSNSDSVPTIDPSTELSLFRGPVQNAYNHNGGGMAFGNDGHLYIAIGDGGRIGDLHSQNSQTLNGSVLRFRDDGEPLVDNPFAGSNGVRCNETGIAPIGSSADKMCSEIYAIGLRNPFRLAMDSNTKDKVRFYVGDVGGKQWEEISEGGTDHMGVNYGWEVREGPCKRDTDIDCDPVVEYDDPIYWYAHRRFTSGGAVTGGSFVPNGVWPKEYDNTYIFVDYTYGEMYHLIDGGEDCRTCSPPTPKFTNATFHSAPSVVDMFFGPYEDTQALYYLSSFDDALRRIIYTGTTNRSPVPVLAVNTSAVLPGDLIQFDASESSDPDDGDSLSYLWTFGDGLTTTDVSPIHSYSELGQYQVELAVEDLSGLRSRAFYIVVVGLPPNVQMNIPVIGATFAVGDRLTLSGQVWYVNGGGDTVQLSELHWEVQQHHAQHFHPFLAPTEGNDFMIDPAPPPEDNVAASNSFLRVVLTGYNEDGLSTSVMRDIMPRLSYLDIASEPSGLQVSVDGSLVTTPANVMSWENHKLHVGIKDQGVNVFREWSSGENREHIVTLSPRNTQIPKITAYFESWIESVAPSIAPSDRLVPPTNLAQQLDEAIPLVAPSIAPSDRFVPSTNSAHQLDEAMPLVAPSIAPSLRFVPSTNSAQQLDEAIPVVTPIKKSCSEKYTCGRCEGHCFVDADCKGGLVCFQKDEGLPRVDSVPGCIGAGTSRTNWCTRTGNLLEQRHLKLR